MSGDPVASRKKTRTNSSKAINTSHILTVFLFIYILVFTAAWGQSREAGGPGIGAPDAPGGSKTDELAPVVVPEATPTAIEYYRSGNWLWILSRAWSIVVLATLVFSGASAWLRDLAGRLGRSWFLTVGLYIIMFLSVMFVIDLPLAYYLGFVRQHAYGLSNQTHVKWLRDSLVGLAVDMSAGCAFLWVPYLLMARSPRRWWIYTALLSVPFLFGVMFIKPVAIDPLFNDFGPMKDKALERSILELAQQAGIDGSRVFEVEKSVDTKAVNAYVTGFWETKRIVLWDTLIKKLSERELLFVMGHEMGHYVLGHVVRSILLSSIVTLVCLFLIDRLGRFLVRRFQARIGFDRLADVASVPLMMMLLEVVFLALSPVALAYSRRQEHEADRFALELTKTNHSAGLSFVKLQTENLSNPRPGWVYKFFRSSHPSISERIDFCNSYHPWVVEQSREERDGAVDRPRGGGP
jgi:STE24 endopeptidase